MTALPFVGVRPRATRALRRLPAAEASERRLKRKVGLIWGLLVLNVLSFSTGVSVIPIPGSAGKVITQGALSLAVLLALMQNPRGKFRPNVFLLLLTLLALETVVTVLTVGPVKGTYYRTFRMLEFVAVLWLLSPYWNRADMLLVRCHMKAMLWVVITVVLGIMVDPNRALNGGRLQDIIWPIASTQVAHYAAVSIGIAAIMWFCGQLRGKVALWYVVVATGVLLLTHTRTALVAMLVALLFGGLSLIATPRVRRLFGVVGGATVVAFAAFSSAITSWMARGEGTDPADQPDRPDELLGAAARVPAHHIPGDLRLRPVQRLVRRPPRRQQLDTLLPGPGPVRRGHVRGDPALRADPRLPPVPRHAAGAGPVPRDLLHRGVLHRGRHHESLDVHARRHGGGLPPAPSRHPPPSLTTLRARAQSPVACRHHPARAQSPTAERHHW